MRGCLMHKRLDQDYLPCPAILDELLRTNSLQLLALYGKHSRLMRLKFGLLRRIGVSCRLSRMKESWHAHSDIIECFMSSS